MDSTTASLMFIGLLLGYLGDELASIGMDERLLWPQRYYYNTELRSLFKAALVLPTGGFLHRATTRVLDTLQAHRILFERYRGHMLGTPFYPDTRLKLIESVSGDPECRNAFFIALLRYCSRKSSAPAPPVFGKRPTRSIQTVTFLDITYEPLSDTSPVVSLSKDTDSITLRSVSGILASEFVSIFVGFGIAIDCRTWFAIIWFLPFAIKLLSAIFSVRREPLDCQFSSDKVVRLATAQLYHPTDGFMIIRGPETVLHQIFHHYGHPLRNPFRESFQIGCIVLLALIFPLGWASLIWMQPRVQVLWLGYQLYLVLALYGYKYFDGDDCCTIVQCLGDALIKSGSEGVTIMRGEDKALKAILATRVVNSVTEGRAVMADIVMSLKS
jgi:hypothetical protein